ncbi:MAG: SEC-C domain-containing protein [Kofleriaceae bacterium]
MITTDPERLAGIANALGAAVRDARAGKRVRLPVIAAEDAAGLVMVMHAQLDVAIAERATEAAAQGLQLACGAGCAACCTSPLLVSEGEAVTVAAWLVEHPEERARFAAAYPVWKRAIGSAGEALVRARSDDDRAAAARELRRHDVMCAFNRDGLCLVYDARPARCRKVHALDTSAACGATGDGQVRYFEHARTEMTFDEQEPMRGAIHHALRPNGGLELLVEAVHRLLDVRVPRNAPCPCGSGKKSKHCCAA